MLLHAYKRKDGDINAHPAGIPSCQWANNTHMAIPHTHFSNNLTHFFKQYKLHYSGDKPTLLLLTPNTSMNNPNESGAMNF
jgi:hypothetical protein